MLCNNHLENLLHALRDCKWATQVWCHFNMCDNSDFFQNDVLDWLSRNLRNTLSTDSSPLNENVFRVANNSSIRCHHCTLEILFITIKFKESLARPLSLSRLITINYNIITEKKKLDFLTSLNIMKKSPDINSNPLRGYPFLLENHLISPPPNFV